MNKDWTKLLPPMLSGRELMDRLACYPSYDASIRNRDAAERLIALSALYDLYLPNAMSEEIYSKLYLATLRSLQKKQTRLSVMQQNENRKRILQQGGNGIIGGADSFSIIGASGIGKSSAIARAVALVSGNEIIETQEPYARIIPCMTIQTPFDSSVKSTLLEILRVVDEHLHTKYHSNALRVRATTDQLIGMVSSVALNHVGLLILDEVQNIVNSKNGRTLIAALTQLINSSGISICMVGTPESSLFFEQAFHLARRSLGLEYGSLPYDAYFKDLCRTLFQYGYVQNTPELTEGILAWLYEHSGGITSAVVGLIHDAQEMSILSHKEQLDLVALNDAYQKRMKLLHGFLEPHVQRGSSTSVIRQAPVCMTETDPALAENQHLITTVCKQAKENNLDVAAHLKRYISIREVQL